MTATLEDPETFDDTPQTQEATEFHRENTRREMSPSGIAFLVLAGISVWAIFFALGISGVSEARAQHVLYATFRDDLAQGLTPAGGLVRPGTPIMLVEAPAGGLNHVVVSEGTDAVTMRKGPGHLRNTTLPGQPGGSVLFGRSVTYGRPFARIHDFRKGDQIRVTTVEGMFVYNVIDVRRAGDVLPPALASSASSLTLVTSEGTGWRAGWAPSDTLYVDAVLTGHTVPAPGGGLSTVPADELAMATGSGSLTALVLWLQGLLISLVALTVGMSRWGRRQTLLVTVPLVVATLWGVTESAVSFLPNLL